LPPPEPIAKIRTTGMMYIQYLKYLKTGIGDWIFAEKLGLSSKWQQMKVN
jgi:hypothetical protein